MNSNATNNIPEATEDQLIESYYSAIYEAVDFVEVKLVPVLKTQINPNNQEVALLGTFYRILLLAKGILSLNDRQHFQLVVSACRTIFELLIDLHQIAMDTSGQLVSQFTAFAEVERFRVAKKLASHSAKVGATNSISLMDIQHATTYTADSTRIANIEAKVRSLWGSDKKNNPNWPESHWSGINLRIRASQVGQYYETLYLQLYSFASWYIHSGSAGYAGFNPDQFGRILGMSVEVSRIMFLDSIKTIAKVFHLNKALEEFKPIMEFLKAAPKEIFISKMLKEIDAKNTNFKKKLISILESTTGPFA